MLIALTLLACKRPPEAPEDLDELASFLFEEHANEDPQVLSAGLENLRAWFESDFDPKDRKCFELANGLLEATVDGLDASAAYQDPAAVSSRSATPLGGASAGTEGLHRMDDYVDALVTIDQDVVFPKTFDEWSRTWRLCDGLSFARRDCDQLESDEQQSANFGFGFKSEGESYNQYRWIELEDGRWAMSHRNWQLFPPDVSNKLMEVADQYYLNTFVPSFDGKSVYRFQATWAVFGDDVPEKTALDLTTGSMFNSSDDLEKWLDER
jgi:hypothetical protein